MDVSYTLLFPSLETFFLSATASLDVYDGSEDPDEICRNLSVALPANQQTLASSGSTDVCAFFDGLATENVPQGRLVMAVTVNDAAGLALMRGCRVADIYGDNTEPVVITLATLPNYPESPNITCTTPEDKCVDRLSCVSQ